MTAEPGLLPLAVRVTERDAARYIGVTAGTLRNWRAAGKGPVYYKLLSRVFYVRRDLDAFLVRCRVEPDSLP
jgi:hypothetical protein